MGLALPHLLARKRDGHAWSATDIDTLVGAVVDGRADPAQVGALLMAVRWQGMDANETAALTRAMADSGRRLQWGDGGPVVDKHATGGVGDATSLVLAPLLAACGARVPMLSGRGLGHTGGTLDKLEAIPGYTVQPTHERFEAVVREAGCAIVGADAGLAPADRILYAARDVTATVDSMPLIVASILSKKLAAGIGTLVLDVKQGNGALMADPEAAAALARALVATGRAAGLTVHAVLSDMDQPLADAAGNALEVQAALAVLTGHDRSSRLRALCLHLAADALQACGLAATPHAARAAAETALMSGAAGQRFDAMQRGLGGPADLLAHPDRHLPQAPCTAVITAPRGAWVAGWDTRALGELVIDLGGGRRAVGDRIDPRVGLSGLLPIGRRVDLGEPIGHVHAGNDDAAALAGRRLLASLRLDDEPVPARPLLLGRVG